MTAEEEAAMPPAAGTDQAPPADAPAEDKPAEESKPAAEEARPVEDKNGGEDPSERKGSGRRRSRSRSRDRDSRRDRRRSRSREYRDRRRSRSRDRRRRRSRSRSRDRDRRRSRSRERDRDRRRRSRSRERRRRSSTSSRSRSRSRSRDRKRDRSSLFTAAPGAPGMPIGVADPTAAAAMLMQQRQAAFQQEMMHKQLMAQQMMAQQQQMAATMAGGQGNKKQRELYVGNLTIGMVTPQMLVELFNGALAPMVKDPSFGPPVVNANVDAEGKFGFVELRSEDLATAALQLDKVELCGRHINVGRPKGYVEGLPPSGPQALGGAAPALPPTPCLLLENMMPAKDLLEDQERIDVADDVREEAVKHGTVLDVQVPKPPPEAIEAGKPGRVYVRFETVDAAKAARGVLHGRTFDGNKIVGTYISEDKWEKVAEGEWLEEEEPPAPPAAPPAGGGGLASLQPGGLPTGPPGMPGMPGMPGLPMMPGMMGRLPGMSAGGMPPGMSAGGMPGMGMMGGGMAAAVAAAAAGGGMGTITAMTPLGKEGVLKLRGLPFTATKGDISNFFTGFGIANPQEDIKIVMNFDGRPSGEAYVIFKGESANAQAAMSKDKHMLGTRYVELFASSMEEMNRSVLTGKMIL